MEFLKYVGTACEDRQKIQKLLASADTCIDFVAEPYPKFSDFDLETWQAILGAIYKENSFSSGLNLRVLTIKEDARFLASECILCD